MKKIWGILTAIVLLMALYSLVFTVPVKPSVPTPATSIRPSQTPSTPGTGEVSAQEFAIEMNGRPVLVSAFSLLALTGLGLGVWRRQQKRRRQWV